MSNEVPVYAYVFFDIAIDGEFAGRLVFRLFQSDCPRTTRNFIELAQHTKGYGYKGSRFHRVIPGYIIQGGDITNHDGTGGRSIYNNGGMFRSENYKYPHDARGLLCTATMGPDTNKSQFYITLRGQNMTHLDKKDVVFGQVAEDRDGLLDQIDVCGSITGDVSRDIRVISCGVTGPPR